MSIAGEQILRLLLWRRYVRRGKSLPLFWTELAQPEFDLVAYLSQRGLLDAQESVELQTLERAYLALYGGKTGDVVDALGGAAALRAILAGVPDEDAAVRSAMRLEYSGRFVPLGEFTPSDEPGHRYTHVSEYGSGGMGRVLIVHDRHLDRDIALKELLPPSEFEGELEDSPAHRGAAMAYRFLQEGMLTAQLEHPAIVPVYEIGVRRDGTPYYTMKLVRGRTLSEEIKRCQTPRERLGLLPNFVTLCQAIAYAHGKGVLHRDIKPANVMVGDFGETVVLDWGIAKYHADKEPVQPEALARFKEKLAGEFGDEVYSLQGQTIGTPGYLSPEQARGQVAQIDERSDVFSLGVVLYELLSGKRAFEASSMAGLLDKTLKEEPPSLRKVAPSIPRELVSICERAMAKEPLRRYQKAQDLVRDLLAFQSGALVASHDYTFRDSLARFYGRNRRVLQVAGGAALVVLCLGAYSFTSIWRARGEEHEQRVRAEEAEQQAVNNLLVAERAREKAQFESRLANLRLLNDSVTNGRFGRVQQLLDSNLLDPAAWETRHAASLTHAEVSRLQASTSPVFQLELRSEENRALTLHNDNLARVWDLEAGTPVYESPPAVERLSWGVLSPDASHLALVDASGRALVVDLSKAAVTADRQLTDAGLISVAFMDEFLFVAGSSTGEIWRCTSSSDEKPRQLAKLDAAVSRLWTTSGSSRFVAQCENNRYHGLSDNAGQVRFDQAGAFQGCAPDGSLGIAIHAGRIRIIELQDGALVWESSADAGVFMKANLTPEGRIVAIALGGQILVYDARTGTLLNDWRAGRPVIDAALSSDGKMLTALDLSGYLYWVDLGPRPRVIQRAGGHLRDTMGVRLLSGSTVATYSFDGTIREWQLDPIVARLHEEINYDEANQIHTLAGVATSPNLLAASSTGTTTLIDAGTGQITQVLVAPALPIPFPVTFSNDASVYATSLDGFTPAIVHPASGPMPRLLSGSTGYIIGLSISADNSQLAAADDLGNITLWNLDSASDAPSSHLKCVTDSLLGVAHLGAAGIVAVSYEGTLFRFSGAPLSLTHQVATAEGRLAAMAVSSRKGILALGYRNGTLELRHADTFDLFDRLPATANPIERIFFDSTGTRIFTGTRSSLQLWLLDAEGKLHDTALEVPYANAAALVGAQEDLWVHDEMGAIPVLRTARPAPRTPPVPKEQSVVALRSAAEMRERTARVRQLAPTWLSAAVPFSVPEIARGSFWDNWGLKPGDNITRIQLPGGVSITTIGQLLDALTSTPADDTQIEWEALRNGTTLRGNLLLKLRDIHSMSLSLSPDEAARMQAEFVDPLRSMSARIDESSARLSAWLPGESAQGIWVSTPPPPPLREWLERMGLSVFDRITQINGESATSVGHLCDALSALLKPQDPASPSPVKLVAQRGTYQEVHVQLTLSAP